MIQHSIYDVTTDSMWTLLFILWTCPNIKHYPSTILKPEYGTWAFCLLLCMVFILFFLFFVFRLLFLLFFVFSSQGKWYVEDPTGAVQVDLTDAVSFVLLKDLVLGISHLEQFL